MGLEPMNKTRRTRNSTLDPAGWLIEIILLSDKIALSLNNEVAAELGFIRN